MCVLKMWVLSIVCSLVMSCVLLRLGVYGLMVLLLLLSMCMRLWVRLVVFVVVMLIGGW